MPGDSVKGQDITAKIAQMTAMSNLPSAFVENPGILIVMEYVEPLFEMPSHHYFTEKALTNFLISDKLLVLLSDVPRVSFTIDISHVSTKPYRAMD